MAFSALQREQFAQKIWEQELDLLVIGGGVTGCGIALDAASRGLKVALLEKTDFAWGTSSRSTKLVHGGLRYLKQLEVALVREVGLERAVAYHNAPHIVRPEKMLLPIVEGGSLGKTMSSIGLWVYDFLAGVQKEERRKMLSAEETIVAEPLLRTDILNGGGLYYEYRTDDARLTIEIAKTAHKFGATLLNYAPVTAFIYENGKICGAHFTDLISGQTHQCKAKKVVNAAGPWVDGVRKLDVQDPAHARPPKRLHLTKGVHVVVPRERLPLRQSAYFDVLKDGRMIFAIPRGKVTYIGTTDTNYKGSTEHPVCTKEDVDYVLAAANYMFPTVKLSPADVVSTWAGLRPLIHEEGKDPSELSRKDEIFHSSTGLISIAGGKLTGYRKMAERIVNDVCKQLGQNTACRTEKMPLGGGDFDSEAAMQKYLETRYGEVSQIGLKAEHINDLFFKYGRQTDTIIERAFELYPHEENPIRRLQMAEAWYCIHHEMSCTLNDYLIRRSGRLYFERQTLGNLFPDAAEDMSVILGWPEEKKYRELAAFKREFDEVISFKENAGEKDLKEASAKD